MWISKCFVLFIIYSFMGWVYETIVCTIYFKSWENRGFLYGPICPVYGVGTLSISMIYDFAVDFMHYDIRWWHIFLFAFFACGVLEFYTSWILEKLFHAVWWDYSRVPFNIQGRICLPASLGFGVAGPLFIYWVIPFIKPWVDYISPTSLEFLSLLLMAVFAADFTLTISALSQFEHMVYQFEKSINDKMGAVVDTVIEKKQNMNEKFTKENLEQIWQNSTFIVRLAVRRVRRLRYPKIDKSKLEILMQSIRGHIKNPIHRNRDRDHVE